MSVGGLIAILVLLVCVVALVFSAVAPAWLPLVLTACLALAILFSGWVLPTRTPPP